MRFFLTRTSAYSQKPCDEATQGTYIYRDVRSTDDPKKIPVFRDNPDGWYGEGTNHRVEHGCIVRDLGEREAWFIEINTLEELVAFSQNYGELVISSSWNHDEPCIEIYDDNRE